MILGQAASYTLPKPVIYSKEQTIETGKHDNWDECIEKSIEP